MWAAFVILGAVLLSVLAFGLAPGAPLVAVPFVLALLAAGWLMKRSRNRRKVAGVRGLREQAESADQDSDEIEFTDRDKQSLYTK